MCASVLALGIYAFDAVSLAIYPWDWSPDEGLFLEYARRFLQDPAALYPHSIIPYPASHGPLLPVVLAPIVALFAEPIRPARVMAIAWTAVIAFAVYLLVRRKGPWPLALAGSALVLSPLDITVWFMLLRVDGLMTALWLLGAVVVLPERLERGADRLSWPRAALGALLLLAAVLVKLSAVAHGIPLVLGWFLVDVRSALRLGALLGGGGAAAFLGLHLATGGGFLRAMDVWKVNPIQPHLIGLHGSIFFEASWMIFVLAACSLLAATRAGGRPFRDGAFLLVAGGLAIVPSMARLGAWWNYLLPLHCATVVLSGRALGGAIGPAARVGLALTALLALAMAASRNFPLPSSEDERTARAFYDFVGESVRHEGKPILAVRPEYAYYVAGQKIEAEGGSFHEVWAARVPGIEVIEKRLDAMDYGLVVGLPLPGDLDAALHRRYRIAGRCELRFFYGPTGFTLHVPRDSSLRFDPPPGSRCRAF